VHFCFSLNEDIGSLALLIVSSQAKLKTFPGRHFREVDEEVDTDCLGQRLIKIAERKESERKDGAFRYSFNENDRFDETWNANINAIILR